MTNFIMGIDGGNKGGIVLMGSDEAIIKKWIMPIIKGDKNTYDIKEIVNIFEIIQHMSNNDVKCILEKAHARFVSGKTQCFTTGYCYGVMQGILTALNIPYEIVDPKVWQKEILKNTGGDTKQASILFITKKYPNENWKESDRCKKYHDGLTDAACIALYGVRQK